MPYFFTVVVSLLVKLCFILLLCFFIANQYLLCTNKQRFSQQVLQLHGLLDTTQASLRQNPQFLKLVADKFQLRLQLHTMKVQQDCSDCIQVNHDYDFPLYQDQQNYYFTRYLVSNRSELSEFKEQSAKSKTWLLIAQIPDNTAWQRSFPALNVISAHPHILLFFVCLILTLLVLLYWPVRKIQKTVAFLIDICQEFANGKLHLRIESPVAPPLQQLAVSLNDAANKVESTFYENQIFSQAIPHEMRTPLSRIQLAVDLIRQSPDKQELLDNIDTYIEDLNDLIVKVLMFSKLDNEYEQRYDDKQAIDIHQFIESRLHIINQPQHITASYQLKGVTHIHCDICYLRLIIDNLLNNAYQYSNSQVSIQVVNDNQYLEFIITDDGPGIDEKNRDKVFLAFSRLDDSRTRRTGGFGLGLAIAKASANRLGSKILIEKNPIGGTIFKFKLRLD